MSHCKFPYIGNYNDKRTDCHNTRHTLFHIRLNNFRHNSLHSPRSNYLDSSRHKMS
uniref:hypothetical protein n=1 Tax=Candidatus Cryptobacteroides bacterium TaxID=3085639 RepID=UPI004029E3DC